MLRVVLFPFLFFLNLFFAIHSFAQEKEIIKGVVLDSVTRLPVFGVNVVVQTNDSVPLKITSDAKGEFCFSFSSTNCIKNIRLSHLTYDTGLLKNFVTRRDQKYTFLLAPRIKELKEVDIEDDEPIRRIRGDTTDYELSHIKYRKNADADETLFLIPEIMLKDGRIFSNGEEVVKITVDGRSFFTSDPMTLFKLLPADAIKKIQLINGLSEEDIFMGYDSGERLKEINVVLKDDMKNGVFGKQIAGIGSSKTYKSDTYFNMFRNDKRFSAIFNNNNINEEANNYSSLLQSSSLSGPDVRKRSLKINVNENIFNYFDVDLETAFKQDKAKIETYRERNLFSIEGAETANRGNNIALTKNNINTILLKLKNSQSAKTRILIDPRINISKIQQTLSSTYDNFILDTLSSSINNNSSTDIDNISLGGTAMLSRVLIPGKNNLGVVFNAVRDMSNSSSDNETFDALKPDLSGIGSYRQKSKTIRKNINAKIVYSHLFNKFLKGYLAYEILKSHYTLVNESVNTKDSTLMGFSIDSILSNNVRWRQRTNKAFGNLNFSNNHFMLASNISFFSDDLDTEKGQKKKFNYLNSDLNLSYAIAPDKNFRLSYTRSHTIPNVQQLQEIISVENPLNISLGNATLTPEVNDKLSISYTSLSKSSSLRMNFVSEIDVVNNKITSSILNLQGDSVISESLILPSGSQIFKSVNLGSGKSIRNSISANFPFIKKGWLLDLELSNIIRDYPFLINTIEMKNQINSTNFKIELGNRTINSSSLSYQVNVDKSSFNFGNSENSPFIINHRLLLNLNYDYDLNNRISSNIEYRQINGGTENTKTSFLLWNIGFETQIVKNLALSVLVYDILNNYRNERRIFNEFYSETQRTNFLGKYFMVNLRYSFRKFGGS
ncbi:outer membrane beta-barrel protein [Olivibacter domesticus]|uniref:CarboxypepD_reg-like domain-containing protein n=1 Tax=Olivibacter domesticus TaxID=407022 RepID=A0A1H7HYR1_OLID1|nr:outer membrane beta-barrel protein [Olivibacter domesticus]SEK55379.1 CarboxypepD_reg-like domain-containing protein [Olivibacter domesticus]